MIGWSPKMGEKIYIGSYEGGTRVVVVPREVLKRADAQLDEARKQREQAEAMVKLQIMQRVRANGRLKRALKAALGWRR